jgi:XTP/dITP diphosphohydrolase
MKVVLATRNGHKIREMLDILGDLQGVEFYNLERFPDSPEVHEDGETLRENAILKAQEAALFTGLLCLAEDTGLEVDALEGRPGVRSARFAGEQASYDQNMDKVLSLLRGIPEKERGARFRSVVAIAEPGTSVRLFEGTCQGRILSQRQGTGGFGYDPIFQPDGYLETFAEMKPDLKNRISHRARALEKVKGYLKELADR